VRLCRDWNRRVPQWGRGGDDCASPLVCHGARERKGGGTGEGRVWRLLTAPSTPHSLLNHSRPDPVRVSPLLGQHLLNDQLYTTTGTQDKHSTSLRRIVPVSVRYSKSTVAGSEQQNTSSSTAQDLVFTVKSSLTWGGNPRMIRPRKPERRTASQSPEPDHDVLPWHTNSTVSHRMALLFYRLKAVLQYSAKSSLKAVQCHAMVKCAVWALRPQRGA